MTQAWPKAKLGDILIRTDRFEKKDDLVDYQFAGTYSYARGIFVSGKKTGASFGLPKIQRIRTNDFVYCKIMAWEGAFGVVPPEADNCVMSGAFVAYEPVRQKVLPDFLKYFFSLERNWRLIGQESSGTNVRRQSLHPSQFEKCEIQLPAISEQKKIIARIDAVQQHLQEADKLRALIADQLQSLFLSLHNDTGTKCKLGDLIELYEDKVKIQPTESYPQVGVRGFGGGLFPKAAVSGAETTYKVFNRLYEDAIVLSQVKGWEGAIAICPMALSDMYVSPEYRTFRCKPNIASPRYMQEVVRSQWFWKYLQDATRGVGARRERVRPEKFLAIELHMPSFSKQETIVATLKALEIARQLRTEAHPCIEALLPSLLQKEMSQAQFSRG